MKTDEEIYEICEKVWVESNSWGLTYNQFIELSFKPSPYKDYRGYALPDSGGDELYTSERGSVLTRHMVNEWCKDWRSFSHGFIKCYRHLEKESQAA